MLPHQYPDKVSYRPPNAPPGQAAPINQQPCVSIPSSPGMYHRPSYGSSPSQIPTYLATNVPMAGRPFLQHPPPYISPPMSTIPCPPSVPVGHGAASPTTLYAHLQHPSGNPVLGSPPAPLYSRGTMVPLTSTSSVESDSYAGHGTLTTVTSGNISSGPALSPPADLARMRRAPPSELTKGLTSAGVTGLQTRPAIQNHFVNMHPAPPAPSSSLDHPASKRLTQHPNALLPTSTPHAISGPREASISRPATPQSATRLTTDSACPADLEPLLSQGIPIRMRSVESLNSARQSWVARFPTGFGLNMLSHPIEVQKDTSQFDFDEVSHDLMGSQLSGFGLAESPIVANPVLRRQSNRFNKRVSLDTLPWRITDAAKKNLMGRRLDLDTSTYFIAVDKGTSIEITPVDSWLSFQSDVGLGQTQSISADIAERKRRAAMQQEAKATELLERRTSHHTQGADEDGQHTRSKSCDGAHTAQDHVFANLYAEDAGLSRQHKKRLAQFLKQKREHVRRDDEDVGDSALNVGRVKRAEVDWDWDDDGKATDDEEDILEEPSAVDAAERQKEEYRESDDEEEQILTRYGQQVTSALETQKEQDAEDELAQFSDDDEAEDDTDMAGTADTGKERSTGDAASSSTTSIARGQRASVANGRDPSAQERPVSATDNAVSESTSSERPKLNEGRSARRPAPAPAAAPQAKKLAEEQRLTADVVRQRVIRTLSLHGGRMPTKQFIHNLNITSNKSELFKLIRKSINEICEVHTEDRLGETVKILELKPEFRQT